MRRAAAPALFGLLAACGGSGPTAATTSSAPAAGWPAGSVVELIDGETGAAVPGSVLVAGASVPSGSAVTASVPAGATVDVAVAGFLARQTSVRTGQTRLVLWPDTAAFPGDYTKSLVYTDTSDGTLAPLRRLPAGVRSVAVSPSDALQANAEVMDALQRAADGMNAALAGRGPAFAVGGSGDFVVPVRVDPADSSCAGGTRRATTWIWLSGAGEVQRAEVVACAEAFARNVGTMTHELGHAFGLRHSTDDRDLMCAMYRSSRAAAPTPRETLAMALLMQRRAGTVWPDNDRNAQAAARRLEIVVD